MVERENMQAVLPAAGGIGAVGLGDILRGILQRRKKLVVVTTLLFTLLGLLFITLATPQYTAASRVLVQYEDTPYTRAGIAQAPAQVPQLNEQDVRSQVEIIRSNDLALKVLRKLNLIGTPEFDPLRRGLGPLSRLKIMLGFRADPRRMTPEQRALVEWHRRLKVYPLPKTRVIVIQFSSSSPQTAARVANALAEFYVEQTRANQLARTGEARKWLKEQIEKLRRKVVEAEKAVEAYRARAGLFKGTQAKLYNQQLSELSAQLVRAEAERSSAEARAKAIRELLKKGDVEKSAEVLRSPLIQRLREQQVQLKRQLAELSTTYLDNHPRVRAVKKALADLKRQINAEARKIAESLEQTARIAAAREAELRKRLAKLKGQVSTAQQDEVKLRELEREAKAQRSLLESFLARYTDAATRQDGQALPRMARIIGRALPPAAPSFPRKGPIMLLAVLAGLILGLGLAFVLEVMAAVREVEEKAVAPASAAPGGAAPAMSPAAPVPPGPMPGAVTAQPMVQPASSPYPPPHPQANMAGVSGAAAQPQVSPQQQAGTIATNAGSASATPASPPGATTTAAAPPPTGLPEMAAAVSRRVAEWHEAANTQLVAITSLLESPGEANAQVIAAARDLAARYRVALLHVDPESVLPGQPHAPGLFELLRGSASFADVVRVDPLQARLHLVAAGNTQALPGDGFDSLKMRQLLQALRENYEIVLLNEGFPRFPVQKTHSVLPLAEAAVILAADEARGMAETLRDTLLKAGLKQVAVIDAGKSQATDTTKAGEGTPPTGSDVVHDIRSRLRGDASS